MLLINNNFDNVAVHLFGFVWCELLLTVWCCLHLEQQFEMQCRGLEEEKQGGRGGAGLSGRADAGSGGGEGEGDGG